MQKKSVSRGLKAFCLLSIVCVNGIIVTEAFSQTNPFPFDAQLRYNGSGAGIDGNTSVELSYVFRLIKHQRIFSISILKSESLIMGALALILQ